MALSGGRGCFTQNFRKRKMGVVYCPRICNVSVWLIVFFLIPTPVTVYKPIPTRQLTTDQNAHI